MPPASSSDGSHKAVRDAMVLKWNNEGVDANCPLCRKIHRTPFWGYYDRVMMRSAECQRDMYRLCFPFPAISNITDDKIEQDPKLGFEIRKPWNDPVKKGGKLTGYYETVGLGQDVQTSQDPLEEKKRFLNAKRTFIPRSVDASSTENFACLIRNAPFPKIYAKSDWTHEEKEEEGYTVISGEHWTDQVFYLCKVIGHEIADCIDLDSNRLGQHYASCAEKQLAAFFISRHAFRPDEKDPEKYFDERSADILPGLTGPCDNPFEAQKRLRLLCHRGMIEWRLREYQRELKYLNRLYRGNSSSLLKVQPPVPMLTEAKILTRRRTDSCWDCRKFFEKVKDVLGITFTIEVVEELECSTCRRKDCDHNPLPMS